MCFKQCAVITLLDVHKFKSLTNGNPFPFLLCLINMTPLIFDSFFAGSRCSGSFYIFLSPDISNSSKEPWFFLVGNGI